nr:synaptotagmin-2 [Vicugna pacos]
MRSIFKRNQEPAVAPATTAAPVGPADNTTESGGAGKTKDVFAKMGEQFFNDMKLIPLPPWALIAVVVLVGLLLLTCCFCICKKCCCKKRKNKKEKGKGAKSAMSMKDMRGGQVGSPSPRPQVPPLSSQRPRFPQGSLGDSSCPRNRHGGWKEGPVSSRQPWSGGLQCAHGPPRTDDDAETGLTEGEGEGEEEKEPENLGKLQFSLDYDFQANQVCGAGVGGWVCREGPGRLPTALATEVPSQLRFLQASLRHRAPPPLG